MNKDVLDSLTTYRKGNYISDGEEEDELSNAIYQELANIYDKISELDVKMKVGEERLKRNILEREIERKDKEIEAIARNQVKYRNEGSAQAQEGGNFNYFILFILGLLFCKAFLC